jgi:ketosteroid isomerase-like protein
MPHDPPTDPKILETLEALNRGYLLAGEKSDVRWYAEHLAEDYMATNPDGSLVDRAGFLARIAKPHSNTNYRTPEVQIQLVGDIALIHARFEDTKPDGRTGGGRYTDIWVRRDGRWLCVSAHFSRC